MHDDATRRNDIASQCEQANTTLNRQDVGLRYLKDLAKHGLRWEVPKVGRRERSKGTATKKSSRIVLLLHRFLSVPGYTCVQCNRVFLYSQNLCAMQSVFLYSQNTKSCVLAALPLRSFRSRVQFAPPKSNSRRLCVIIV